MVYRYYHRLSHGQKHTYRRSDELTAIEVPGAGDLRLQALVLAEALRTGDAALTTASCRAFLDELCRRLGVPAPAVAVLADRPAGHWGELHGLYNPGGNGRITVWMRTARRRQVVAFRTFLRTLLHELCHHLDFVLLKLDNSFHTAGFYKRESSLYRQLNPLGPGRQPAPRPPKRFRLLRTLLGMPLR